MEDDELTTFYASDEPDIDALRKQYRNDITDLSDYADQTVDADEQRYAYWPGKSDDLRKHGPNSQPWEGASDQEVRLIENAITKYIGLFMTALDRSNIRAFPREAGDIERSRDLSTFLKWLRDSGIENFRHHMELGANHLLEKGLVVTYCGFKTNNRLDKQEIDIEEIRETAPDLVELMLDESREDEVIETLRQSFENVNRRRAKKALKELREKGVAEIPVVVEDPGRPVVETHSADADIVLPSYVTSIQKSPRITVRALMTPQEVEMGVVKEGWDKDWADDLIENYQGVRSHRNRQETQKPNNTSNRRVVYSDGPSDFYDDLIEVLFTFRRLFDKEDGAEGIYLTIWHEKAEGLGLHELQVGMTEYPFVATRLIDAERQLLDITTFSDLLRGPQRQAKVVRDGWSDQHSLAVMPPLVHPMGRAPSSFGAGAWIGARPNDRYEFLQVPNNVRTDTQIENFIMREAFDLVGLDAENPLSSNVQAYYINKFLTHVRDCLRMCYNQHVLFGPEEIAFRVTGQPDPVTLRKNDLDTDLDVHVSFDSLNQDPENMRAKVEALQNLMQADTSGRFDESAMLEIAANMIDPSVADEVLRPREEARQETVRKVAEDLALIWSGQGVNARETGAQVALEYIQSYTRKQSVAQRLQNDPEFAEALQNYMKQYQFQLQQNRNAQTGRVGTEPAPVSNVETR